jgi:hypothetical protein
MSGFLNCYHVDLSVNNIKIITASKSVTFPKVRLSHEMWNNKWRVSSQNAVCYSFEKKGWNIRTDGDFYHQGRHTEIAQNILRLWPFIGKLLRSTFWWCYQLFDSVFAAFSRNKFILHTFTKMMDFN